MMKKLLCLAFAFMFLFNLIPVFSVEITSCTSGVSDWTCEIGKICTCTISGNCTDGYLLLYQGELSNPVCSPEIGAGPVEINWDYCDFTGGLLDVRADCEEGQSSKKTIMVSVLETTTTTSTIHTTSTTTVPPTTTSVSEVEETEECGPGGYCEDLSIECKDDYEYCPEYNGECEEYHYYLRCCCPKEARGGFIPEINMQIVTLIILAIAVGVVVFLFFIRKMKVSMSFEELYKKWTKIYR